jgi:hypothetical protein
MTWKKNNALAKEVKDMKQRHTDKLAKEREKVPERFGRQKCVCKESFEGREI